MPANIRRRGRPKNFYENKGQSTIQSLDRAVDVLELLAKSGGMILSDIAADLGQSPATIYRILTTYARRNMVEFDPATQTWAVGSTAFRLGSAFLRRNNLVERSRPVMRALMEFSGETANLGIESDGQILFVSQVETQETIRAFFPPGNRAPMHSSGIGKALLGQFSQDRLARFLAENTLEKFTQQTITSIDRFRQELDDIQRQGFAFDNQEHSSGMRCIAAPVIDHFGEPVAGISVSGPIDRMPMDRISAIAAKVIKAAATLSTRHA